MKLRTCKARQESDSMVCHECGVQWDINDPEPPKCLNKSKPLPPQFAEKGLPIFNIPDTKLSTRTSVGMLKTPEGYTVVEETLVGGYDGRIYTMFDDSGNPLRKVRVFGPYSTREVSYPILRGRVWLDTWEQI